MLDLELLSEVVVKEEREDMLEHILKEEEEEEDRDYKKEAEETDFIVKEEVEYLELERDEVTTQANYQGGNRV